MSDLPERSALDELSAAWRAAWEGSGFSACCTPDIRYEDPVAVEPTEGVEALEALAARMRAAFPDIRVEGSAAPLGRGPHACLPWRALGTHRGEIAALPATERFVVLHGVHYVEIVDGAVRRARGFYDLYDVATQLGLLPKRGSLGESALMLLRGFGLR
ncbi:MAG TPA: ester cyclase [Thermoleophilaceae bacterium]|nr:ester cyclase [Thermoleophilaceae bacterium]